ncbi:E3 ubiquitin-protein ligase TRIM16-like [Gouania willdenowi]|uniref:E3 ubiquitin-protein ligase TRIM16-like n=1 Tax=Gouania willdenowi TaxID=441366 RepID=A0A8C5EUF1_GOUWI|nr:E3 ubiquitin-protein ligase TRIM16-like [Gouania willdenowi]XP_028316566.1 E3 ubiquitin-protein ligase TRIM16-like [Gouania willdenowi]
MAQIQKENFSCSICLNLLKEPVTVPCGHSYCRTCINNFWDVEKKKDVYSCPQCRQKFTPRPVLMTSTMLAELVEELRKSRIQDDPCVQSFAGAEDVTCDVCTGRKVKAVKSCLTCVTSYCEEHLQRHNEITPSKRHRLVDPSKKLQENICSRHNEVMKMFCRTDQQCICILCSMEEHKGHDMVSGAAERTERQRELQESQADIHKNIQDREKGLQVLNQQLISIQLSADHAVQHSQLIITELIRVLNKRSSELEKEVRSKQQTEVSAVRAHQKKLQQEISELKKRDAELQQISTTEDHIQFVLRYSSLSALSVSTHSSITHTHPHSCFQELTEHLHTTLREDWTKVCGTVKRVKVLQLPEPTSKAGFIQEITLDPNTANKWLRLSEGNRKVTLMRKDQHRPHHPHRFTEYPQVLSRESLTGRCYWEVEVGGRYVSVGVAYKSIIRNCEFGSNDKSWMLECFQNNYTFIHNGIRTKVSGPASSRIGVYVDHIAATLSFYSVGDTMTLLLTVNTTFTEPLHAGVYMYYYFNTGASAEFYKL